MKTTFNQFLLEGKLPKARSGGELENSIRGGRFTKDGSHLDIAGSFYCDKFEMISLVGSPRSVGANFQCQNNKLTSLEGAPSLVGGDFYCRTNRLSSLKDIHKHIKEIKGIANFEGNLIRSHVLGLLKIKKLRAVYLDSERVQNIINKYLPEGDIFACQQELIDAGYEEYAKL